MTISLDLPDDLQQRLEAYLATHPQDSFAAIIEDALAIRPLPERPEALLELAGIVEQAPYDAVEHAEDRQL